MKSAFIFDTILLKDYNDYYGMTLTYDFLSTRYLKMYDELVVTTRVNEKKNQKNVNGYKITNGKNIRVIPIESYKNIPDALIRRKNIEKELMQVINNVDEVIIRMPSVLGIIACEICNKIKKNYLIEMVACAWDGYINHTNPIGKIIAPIMYYLSKKCVYMAPKVLYVTNSFLQKRYPTKGKNIACSDVVLEECSSSIIENRMQRINQDSDILNLCTVANVEMKYKGHEYVIKALAKLNKNKKMYKYFLIGNGRFDRLEKIAKKYNIEDDVIFLGSKTHNEVFKEIEKMDIYIQPSLQEGLPRALLEAMSVGCPCIGSNAGGITELLSKKVIFKRRNIKELEKVLTYLYKNTDVLLELSKENYNKSKEYRKEILDEKRFKFYTKKG